MLIYSHSSQPGTVLPPGDVWTLLETFLVVSRRVVLASSVLGPGMLLKVLYHTGQPPRRWILQPRMLIGVPRLRRWVYFPQDSIHVLSPEVLRQGAAGDFLVTHQIETDAAEGLKQDFLGGSVVKNLPTNAGNSDLIPWVRKTPGVGNGNPLLCSSLENPMDTGAWGAAVHGVAQSEMTEHARTCMKL